MTVPVAVSDRQDKLIIDGYEFDLTNPDYSIDDYLRDRIIGFKKSMVSVGSNRFIYFFNTEENAALFKMRYLT